MYECGPVRVVVRHSFAAGWGVRVALTNLTDEPLEIDDAGLSWVADPDAPAWALAAGASGAYAVPSPDGTGPLLGGVLALGACEWVTAEAMGFSRLTVAPRGRFVVQWTWEWYRPGQGFGRNRHLEVPRSLYATVDEPLDIVADEDTALSLPRGVVEERERGHSELSCWEPGRFTVELVSARGVTRYDLHAAQPYDEVITDGGDHGHERADEFRRDRPAGRRACRARRPAGVAGRLGSTTRTPPRTRSTCSWPAPWISRSVTPSWSASPAPSPAGPARTNRWTPRPAGCADQQALTPGLGMAVSQASLMRVLRGFEVQPLIDWLIGLRAADVAGPIMAGHAPRANRGIGPARRAGTERRSDWRPRWSSVAGWAPV